MELTWANVYDQAVAGFGGQTPGRVLEAEIVEIFLERPADVRAAIAKVTARFASGHVHTPWPVVRRELEQGARRHEIVADDDSQRRLAERKAELYVRNAGLYLPTEDELLDELFGKVGLLRVWEDDGELHRRMIELWLEHRPRGERAEAEAEARGLQHAVARPRPPAAPASALEPAGWAPTETEPF
jgi:hypothetical protein